jgi:hypothetical protein
VSFVRGLSTPLQRSESNEAGASRHRASPNRHGVVVPFRVFSVHGVARTWGSSLPVRSLRSPNARPFRYSFHDPGPRTRLLGRSSPGVRPSFTVSRCLRRRSLDRRHLSWGFAPLQRSRKSESTSSLRWRRPVTRSAAAGSQPSASVSLAGFRNLSATSSSLRRPAVFRRVALVGFYPSGGCSSHEAPTTRRRRCAFLTLFPWIALARVLGASTLGRTLPLPRMVGLVPFWSSRPSSS